MSREELLAKIKANPGIRQQQLGNKGDGRNSRFLQQMERDGIIIRMLTERGVGNGSGAPGYRVYPVTTHPRCAKSEQ